MSDRRNEKRWDVSLDAVWDGKSGNYSARVTDLSEGGCYVDTLGEAQVGEILSLKIQLPTGEWLELSGEVAHQTPPLGFGMRFENLSDEQVNNLRSVIGQLDVLSTRVVSP
jgi:Tfp pilus assembly protein PilZ